MVCELKGTSKAHPPESPEIYHSYLQVTGMWTVLARLFLPTNLTTTMWNFISAPFRILYFTYNTSDEKVNAINFNYILNFSKQSTARQCKT